MSYRYLEDIATADIAFEATGKTIEEAFTNAAMAAFSIITDLKQIRSDEKREINIEAEDLESLLFDWIDELLLFWDSERLVFSKYAIKINKTSLGYRLKGIAYGEEMNQKKHKPKQNVKSPTYHLMKIENKGGIWSLRMVIDI